MTTTNVHIVAWAVVFAVLLWSTVLLWVHFMLLRMLRWKYLEMKYAPQWTPTAGRPSPPAPTGTWTP